MAQIARQGRARCQGGRLNNNYMQDRFHWDKTMLHDTITILWLEFQGKATITIICKIDCIVIKPCCMICTINILWLELQGKAGHDNNDMQDRCIVIQPCCMMIPLPSCMACQTTITILTSCGSNCKAKLVGSKDKVK